MSKENLTELIEKESESLNSLLDTEDLKAFQSMTSELKDTWIKKQMFRTETEARFSVLQDNRCPTNASKYWQCVREQASDIDNRMALSFDHKRNQAQINRIEDQLETEKDKHELAILEIELDECRYQKASMEKTAYHRVRELKMWSKLKSEYDDGTFDTQDVNEHQLESYGRQYADKAQNLTEHSSDADKFNVLGQLKSLQRIKKSGELENKQKKLDE